MMSTPVENRRPTFWVGASGSATGFGILRSIRDHWGAAAHIVALDTNPQELNASSVLADEYIQVPAVASPEYQKVLDHLFRSVNEPTIYVPVYDSEILEAARRLEGGGLPEALRILTAGRADAVAACNDKLAACQTMTAASIPAAATVLLAASRFAGVPLALKPRYGVASTVSVVRSEAELSARQSALGADEISQFVAQELCGHPEVTIDVFIGRAAGPNERVKRALCRERLETKAGVVTKCRIFDDVHLFELGIRLGEAFELRGSFCFQVMRSPDDGGWLVTDVNPRPGGGTRMSAAIGCDFMAAAVADFLGERVGSLLGDVSLPQVVVRQHVEYVTTLGTPGTGRLLN